MWSSSPAAGRTHTCPPHSTRPRGPAQSNPARSPGCAGRAGLRLPSGSRVPAELKHQFHVGKRQKSANRFIVQEGGVGADLLRWCLGWFRLLVVAAAVIILLGEGKPVCHWSKATSSLEGSYVEAPRWKHLPPCQEQWLSPWELLARLLPRLAEEPSPTPQHHPSTAAALLL